MDLEERWRAFRTAVLDPWAVLLAALTVGLALAVVQLENPPAVWALTVMLSVVAGIFGGLVTSRWNVIAEEGPAVTRGKVAVRSLKLLLANIDSLEQRVSTYLERWRDAERKERLSDEVVETYLEEVIRSCGALVEGALSSIENWTDIIPEADIRTQIGVISSLKEERAELTQHLDRLMHEFEEVKGRSEEEARELRAEISDRTEELRDLNRQLRAQVPGGFGSIGRALAGGLPVGGVPVGSFPRNLEFGVTAAGYGRSCSKCDFRKASNQILPDDKCPRCGSDLLLPGSVRFP